MRRAYPTDSSDGADVAVVDGGALVGARWGEFHGASSALASRLRRGGVGHGCVVVAAGESSYENLLLIFATWRCGAAISLMPSPRYRGPAFHSELVERVRLLRPRAVCLPGRWWDELGWPSSDWPAPIWAIRAEDIELMASPGSRTAGFSWPPSDVSLDDVAIYQATSGTTGQSQFVPVTWRMLIGNVGAIVERLRLDERDRLASWMPLFHDMGLIAFVVLPALLGARLCLVDPRQFGRAPWQFLDLAAASGATFSGSPTTGLVIMERALARMNDAIDLSALARIACGAEMVDLEASEAFVAAGRRHRLREDVLAFAYGLAEATLAVSIRPPDAVLAAEAPRASGATTIEGDAGWTWAAGRGFARTGSPLAGVDVRVVSRRAGGRVGEIQVRGQYVFDGYVDVDSEHGIAGGPDADGWFGTGDLGYVDDGEVVIVGRIKDVIIVGGRNVVPEHIERIVMTLPGVGRNAAFSLKARTGEGFGIVAEQEPTSSTGVADVRAALRRHLDLSPEVVRFVGKGQLPRTTSGKVRRAACRELAAADTQQGVVS